MCLELTQIEAFRVNKSENTQYSAWNTEDAEYLWDFFPSEPLKYRISSFIVRVIPSNICKKKYSP